MLLGKSAKRQVIKRSITELPRPEALRSADLADLSGWGAGLLDARGSAQATAQASALAGVAGILGLHSDDDSEEDVDL